MKLFIALAATGVFMFLAMLYFAINWVDSLQAYQNLEAEHIQQAAQLAEARKQIFSAAIKVAECQDE